jgi:hypothetical protein
VSTSRQRWSSYLGLDEMRRTDGDGEVVRNRRIAVALVALVVVADLAAAVVRASHLGAGSALVLLAVVFGLTGRFLYRLWRA